MVECAFDILANKWRIFFFFLYVTPQFCDSVGKACCILHNFVQLEDTWYESNFESIQAAETRGNIIGKHVRDYFAKYFTSPHEAVPWHYDKASFGI
jgi:hypothetical protein